MHSQDALDALGVNVVSDKCNGDVVEKRWGFTHGDQRQPVTWMSSLWTFPVVHQGSVLAMATAPLGNLT